MAPTTTGALAPPGTTPHLAGPSRENPEHRNLPRITTHSIKAMADDAEDDSMLRLGGNTANNATGGGGDPTRRRHPRTPARPGRSTRAAASDLPRRSPSAKAPAEGRHSKAGRQARSRRARLHHPRPASPLASWRRSSATAESA